MLDLEWPVAAHTPLGGNRTQRAIPGVETRLSRSMSFQIRDRKSNPRNERLDQNANDQYRKMWQYRAAVFVACCSSIEASDDRAS
jgi:hypothetical protein